MVVYLVFLLLLEYSYRNFTWEFLCKTSQDSIKNSTVAHTNMHTRLVPFFMSLIRSAIKSVIHSFIHSVSPSSIHLFYVRGNICSEHSLQYAMCQHDSHDTDAHTHSHILALTFHFCFLSHSFTCKLCSKIQGIRLKIKERQNRKAKNSFCVLSRFIQ